MLLNVHAESADLQVSQLYPGIIRIQAMTPEAAAWLETSGWDATSFRADIPTDTLIAFTLEAEGQGFSVGLPR